MSALGFVSKFFDGHGRRNGTATRKRTGRALAMEALEDRRLMSHSGMTHHMLMMPSAHHHHHAQQAPSSRFQQTNLVSDQMGVAQVFDPNLINAWGISESPNGGAFWVSANGSGRSP